MNHSEISPELSFEEAMRKLDELLRQMDDPNETLDNLIRFYEEGSYYIKIARQRLTEAEGKVRILNEKMAKEMPQEEN